MLSIRRISILLRAEGLLMYAPAWVYCYTITHQPQIEWFSDDGDSGDGWDGGDDSNNTGLPCTLRTSFSERDGEWNNKVKPRLIILFTRFSLFLFLLPLPLSLSLPFLCLTKWWGLDHGACGKEIDGERITVKRID